MFKNKLLKIIIFLAIAFIAITAIIAFPIKASALTDTAGMYTISGSYDIGEGSSLGYMDKFKIQISTENYQNDMSRTEYYNNQIFDWNYFSFHILAEDISEHVSFLLEKDGKQFYYSDLSGNYNVNLYEGRLPSGYYELTYVGKYKANFFVTNTYTFKYNFSVDITPPSYILSVGDVSSSSGCCTNERVVYSCNDVHPDKIYYLAPWASSYSHTTDSTFTIEPTPENNGYWKIYSVDALANASNTVEVHMDTVNPVGQIYNASDEIISNGSYVSTSIKYIASDNYAGIKNLYVKPPQSTTYIDYSLNSTYSTDGVYYFYCTDKFGNTSSVSSVVVDTIKPTCSIIGDGVAFNSGEYCRSETITFVSSDNNFIAKEYIMFPDTNYYVETCNGAIYTAEGKYSYYCVDAAGNRSDTYKIYVDRTSPVISLVVDGKKIDDNYHYTNGSNISFVCGEKGYVMLPNNEHYIEYVSGTEFNESGRYVFYTVDDAGNSSGEYVIIIDRDIVPIILENVEGKSTDKDVTVSWNVEDCARFAPLLKVTVNGVEINNGQIIHTINGGTYNIFAIDSSGNTWDYTFTSTQNNFITNTLRKDYYETYSHLRDYYSFSSYESALKFACEREFKEVMKAEWKSSIWDCGIAMDEIDSKNAMHGVFYIYKSFDNPEKSVAYFTEERLNEVVKMYASSTIEKYYYWQKIPSNPYADEILYPYIEEKTVIGSMIEISDRVKCAINGSISDKNVIANEGIYTITVMDDFGNTSDYYGIVVGQASQICYSLGGQESNDAD